MLTVETVNPCEAGIPADAIIRFIEKLDRCRIPMHSVLLMRHNKLLAEGYYAPYKTDTLHRMFSICKTMNALGIGLLEEEGKLSTSDPVAGYFPDKVPANPHPWIMQMTIRDLLMMRTCHAATTFKLTPGMEWVESFFTAVPSHKPGTVFHYDTSAAHVLCMLVQRLTGKSMLDYLKDKVLREIGWSETSYVVENMFGDPQGGSGLMATPMDMLLLGRLLLNHGNWNGRQLLPRAFVDKATSNLSPTLAVGPINSEMQGYGYQIWRAERNSFVCYGMGGQLVLCMPEHDLILVTTADTQGYTGANQHIYNSFFDEVIPAIDRKQPEEPGSCERLQNLLAALAIAPVGAWTPPARSSLSDRINHKTFLMEANPNGFHSFRLDLDGTEGSLAYAYNGIECTLPFGLNTCIPGSFPVYGLACATSGAWLTEDTFYLRSHIIDTAVGSVHFELVFGDDDVTIFMKKIEESTFHEYEGHLYGKIPIGGRPK